MTKAAAIAWFALALPFLAVGGALSWMVGSTIGEALRARNWVKTRAEVLFTEVTWSSWDNSRAIGSYKYEVAGRPYESDRLGLSTKGAGILDDWPSDMYEFMKAARDEKRPIMVWVNPAEPSQAVIDRTPGTGTLLLLLPLAFAFAGWGVACLRAAWKAVREVEGEEPPEKPATRRTHRQLMVLLGMAFFVNAFAWPTAIWVVNTLVADGRQIGLAVVLFPLAGLWIAWKALVASIRNRDELLHRSNEDE
jgi:hypothetical protein